MSHFGYLENRSALKRSKIALSYDFFVYLKSMVLFCNRSMQNILQEIDKTIRKFSETCLIDQCKKIKKIDFFPEPAISEALDRRKRLALKFGYPEKVRKSYCFIQEGGFVEEMPLARDILGIESEVLLV